MWAVVLGVSALAQPSLNPDVMARGVPRKPKPPLPAAPPDDPPMIMPAAAPPGGQGATQPRQRAAGLTHGLMTGRKVVLQRDLDAKPSGLNAGHGATHGVRGAAERAEREAVCAIAHELNKCSNCPAAKWQDAVAPLLLEAGGGRVALLTIGAAKGYNFFQRHPPPPYDGYQPRLPLPQVQRRRVPPALPPRVGRDQP